MLHGFLGEAALAKYRAAQVTRRYTSAEAKEDKAAPQSMGAIMRKALERGSGLSVEQRVIAVRGAPRQDMTWAAQEAYEEALKSDPPWKDVVSLFSTQALASILKIAGWGAAYRALRSHGITVPRTAMLRAMAVLVPLASLGFFCAAVYMAVAYARTTSVVYVLSLVMVGLGALVWHMGSSRVQALMIGRLATVLADPDLDVGAAAAAGRALGGRLVRTDSVMVLIVDDYHRLPLAVREAAVEAFCERHLNSAVTWVIFDSSPAHLLEAEIARIRKDSRAAVALASYGMCTT